jgi:signal transduction histidine kinase
VEHGSTDGRSAVDDEFVRGADDPAADATDGVTVRLVGLDDGRGFAVEDDGPGIPPAEREQVFDRGFSTATDGTGFGLAIVRRVAAAHGWSVAVEESAAGGARFEVRTGSGE